MKIKRVEHIAIAVNSLKQSIDLLGSTFGLPLEYEEQIGQTRLAMLPVGETYIELLEGQGPESGVSKWMSDHGPGCATRLRASAMAAYASLSSIRPPPATS